MHDICDTREIYKARKSRSSCGCRASSYDLCMRDVWRALRPEALRVWRGVTLQVITHTFCLCSDQLDESDDPLFGQIYDLGYTLCVLQLQVCKEDLQYHPIAATELVILAVQLHV